MELPFFLNTTPLPSIGLLEKCIFLESLRVTQNKRLRLLVDTFKLDLVGRVPFLVANPSSFMTRYLSPPVLSVSCAVLLGVLSFVLLKGVLIPCLVIGISKPDIRVLSKVEVFL